MPQHRLGSDTTPSPRRPLPRIDRYDHGDDDEPSVVLLEDILERETLEVVEEDIETRRIDARAVQARVRAARAHEASLSRPRPAPDGDTRARCAPTSTPAAPLARSEPSPTPRARRGGAAFVFLLGILAFFGGWRATGGAGWLDHATLGDRGDRALASAKVVASHAYVEMAKLVR